MHKCNVNGMIILYQIVMIMCNSCNRLSPGKKYNLPLTYEYINNNTKARVHCILSHEWLNHLSIHYRKPFTVHLNHSPTPGGEGTSRMREVRMSTSCSRAMKECGWHYPLSTEEQVYPFIHHHQRIHTHSLFIENIWTQLPALQKGEQQFLLPLEFGGGRTNRAVIYTRERKRNSPRFLRTAVSRTWVSLSLLREREKDIKRDESCVSSTTSLI